MQHFTGVICIYPLYSCDFVISELYNEVGQVL